MRRLLAVAILTLLAVGSASAQEASSSSVMKRTMRIDSPLLLPGDAPSLAPKWELVQNPRVLDEIKASPAQRAELEKAAIQVQDNLNQLRLQRAQAVFDAQESGDAEALLKARQEMSFGMTGDSLLLNPAVAAPLLKLLSREQKARLDQLQLQMNGPLAFRIPEIQERLNIGPDQIEQLDAIIENGMLEIKKAIESPGLVPSLNAPPRSKTTEADKQYRKEHPVTAKARAMARETKLRMIEDVGKVLTKRQRERITSMLGKPFDFSGTAPKPTPPASPPQGATPK